MARYHQATTQVKIMSKKSVIAKVVTVKGAEIVQPPAVLDAVLSGDLHFLPPIDPRWVGGGLEVKGR